MIASQSPPPGRSISVTPVRVRVQGKAAADGEWPGINHPLRGCTDTGEKVVFKHNALSSLGSLSARVDERQARLSDEHEIMGTHLMTELFGLPCAVAREAEAVASDGTLCRGIVTPFIDGLKTLDKVSTSAVTNPDEAVGACVVKGWMGDWDSVVNDSNVWLRADGTAMACDYGFAFQEGISTRGLPKANLRIMRAFASAENVEPVVAGIRALTDDEIRGTVDRIGRENIDGWTASQGSLFADPLIHNRDRLRRDNVFADYYRGVHATVHPPLRQLLAPLVNVNHDTTHIAMMCIAGAPGAAGAWLMRHLACGAAHGDGMGQQIGEARAEVGFLGVQPRAFRGQLDPPHGGTHLECVFGLHEEVQDDGSHAVDVPR